MITVLTTTLFGPPTRFRAMAQHVYEGRAARNREHFHTLWEARAVGDRWRQAYKQVRPYSALGYRAPAPETIETHPMWA